MKKIYSYTLLILGMFGLCLSAILPSLGYISLHTGHYIFTTCIAGLSILQYIPAITSKISPRKEKIS